MINILVTGANGQLGSELKSIYNNKSRTFEKPVNIEFTDIETLDLSNTIFLKKFLDDHSFDYIINCAAYTNVDLAETEKEKAFEINANCVKSIVEYIKGKNTKLIHISTDYIFDGESFIPYTEDIPSNPQSVYGNSKLEGEKYALEHTDSIVIRTSWLYSSYGKNFAKTIYKLCKEREELNVVFDQIGTPTYAADLAKAILQIVNQSIKENRFIPGVYHYSNEGVCSWFDFAQAIADKAYSKCKINPIISEEYPTASKRPFYSVLNKSKIKSVYQISIPHWQKSLNNFFEAL
jgi:dTDP-4-dehydrorhamnose reductase